MDQPKRFACTVIQIKSSAYIVSDYESQRDEACITRPSSRCTNNFNTAVLDIAYAQHTHSLIQSPRAKEERSRAPRTKVSTIIHGSSKTLLKTMIFNLTKCFKRCQCRIQIICALPNIGAIALCEHSITTLQMNRANNANRLSFEIATELNAQWKQIDLWQKKKKYATQHKRGNEHVEC